MLRGVNNSTKDASASLDGALLRQFRRRGRNPSHASGFTLLEMIVVISVMIILISIAIPNYNRTVIQARESVLRSNLSMLRSVISQYTLDKQKAPQSLDDLVTP